MVQVIRHVVTGHDREGKSEFIFDGGATAAKRMR